MPNRLAGEKSPYLLQHAENPVEWYPWGEEAFLKASREDKPIFLSIGYATCHWCHVMEHESFEDEEVAGLLNRSFVSDKGGSRGASGHRPGLHDRVPGDHGWRRVAAVHFYASGQETFFRRDLFPQEKPDGNAGFNGNSRQNCRTLGRRAGATRQDKRRNNSRALSRRGRST